MTRPDDSPASDGYPVPDKRRPPSPSALMPAPAAKRADTPAGERIAALVRLVSADRLREHVTALTAFHTRHTFSPNLAAAAEWLVGRFTTAGYGDAAKVPWTRSGHTADNVVCVKPGTGGSGPVVVLCAHYDCRMADLSDSSSRAPGADDNASGVAAVLEIAGILRDVPLRHTVQFVAFSGEEQGLWGSSAYAAQLGLAGTRVHRLINLDMIGFRPPDGSITVERDLGNAVPGNDADSQAFGEIMARAAADHTTLPVRLGPIFASDYMPFEARGHVTIGAYEGEGNPHYHETSDDAHTLDYGYLAAVTRLTLATLLMLSLDEDGPGTQKGPAA
ncbi:M28 family metallopeptidase [Planobispora siamensis]|uniref:Zn-dependent exopeptidase M28 n=1 Tax=Planobispora siamensis TaxID=936338 RepID=A0A8J3SHL8_9ACTN|nr:M20/M25/M40 family metallo-hydrolase [Planobispora siamensis]GIH92736.1 Zn-dependent exopeptidase M28 [Planobispora siamensis]